MARMQLISRGGQPSSQQQQAAPAPAAQEQAPTIGGGSEKRAETIRGLFALGRGIEAPVAVASGISGFFGGPTMERPTESIRKSLGYTPEQLEPQSFGERVVNRFAEIAPTTAALGGLPALGRAAAGSAVGGGLESAGLPKGLADIGQIATEIGTGFRSGRIPTLKGQQASAYQKAEEALAQGERHIAGSLGDVIRGVKSDIGTEVSEKISNKINHALDTVEKNIVHGFREQSYNPKTLFDVRKKLYSLRREVPYNAKPYIDKLTKGINEQFINNAAENPAFYENLNRGDKLTQLKYANTLIDEFMGLSFIEPMMDKLGGIPKAALELIEKPVGFLEKVVANPTARGHYFDVVKASVNQNPGAFVKALTALEEEAPTEVKEPQKKPSPNKSPAKGRMQLISRANQPA